MKRGGSARFPTRKGAALPAIKRSGTTTNFSYIHNNVENKRCGAPRDAQEVILRYAIVALNTMNKGINIHYIYTNNLVPSLTPGIPHVSCTHSLCRLQ